MAGAQKPISQNQAVKTQAPLPSLDLLQAIDPFAASAASAASAATLPPPAPNDPQDLSAWRAYAEQMLSAAQWGAAEQACLHLLQFCPQDCTVLDQLALLYQQTERAEQALILLERVCALAPNNADYHFKHANVLFACGLENEAAMAFRRCLQHDPDHTGALWNYGEYLRLSEHYAPAAACFERILALDTYYPALHHRLAACYCYLGRLDEGRRYFALAKEDQGLDPQSRAVSHWELALVELGQENFDAGWQEYEHRFDSGGKNQVYCYPFPQPKWRGESLRGKTLLVHGEQGFGDEIMFASMVPRLLARCAEEDARLILAVKPGLQRLFAASFAQAEVRAHDIEHAPVDTTEFARIDVQCPIGDLPRIFAFSSTSTQEQPPAPYLFADAGRAAYYQQQLCQQDPRYENAFKIGLMWGSAPNLHLKSHATWAVQRSVALPLWAVLADLEGTCFVSLQNSERGAEAATAPALRILDTSAEQSDFFETAALIANLDLVLSVDTSVAHLAGAMGKPVWQPLMLRSDWRHGKNRKQSYWYPNVRYFQQTQAHNWFSVLEQIKTTLQTTLAQHAKT